jgi:biopolymer transport protein ExbD
MNSAVQRQVRHHRRRLQPGINLTPMLDVLFNLIFFFILATNIRDESLQMEISLPRVRSATTADEADRIPVVTIGAAGAIEFKGRTMVEEEFQLELRALVRDGVRHVRLRCDEMAPTGQAVRVMDACKLAGLEGCLLDALPASDLTPGRMPPTGP